MYTMDSEEKICESNGLDGKWDDFQAKRRKTQMTLLHITTTTCQWLLLLLLYTMPLIYNPCQWHWMNSFMREILFLLYHCRKNATSIVHMWRLGYYEFIMYYHDDCCSGYNFVLCCMCVCVCASLLLAHSVTINCVYSFELIPTSQWYQIITRFGLCVARKWHSCCLLRLLLLLMHSIEKHIHSHSKH